MMKVYIVLDVACRSSSVEKVFLSSKDADDYVGNNSYMYVEEHDVIGEEPAQ